MTQIAGLLRSLDQTGIDRVAAGLDEFSIIVQAAGRPGQPYTASRGALAPGEAPAAPQRDQTLPRWQILYADDELQITHRGQASREQRAQVRLAAAYIRRLLE